MKKLSAVLSFTCSIACILSAGFSPSRAQSVNETPQEVLAAQIRLQGFACDKALGARKDTKHSKPDHQVWVLRCGNAIYRVSRAPDLAAKVELLP